MLLRSRKPTLLLRRRAAIELTYFGVGTSDLITHYGLDLKTREIADVPNRDQHRIQPRGLSRVEAAAYIGVSASLFDALVVDRRMPAPKRINSRVVWDRYRLDEAFEELPDTAEINPWDEAVA